MKELFVNGRLSKDFTNVTEKQEFTFKNRKQTKEGVFVSINNPTIEGEIDTDGMSEGMIPKWAKEDVEYFNTKSSFALDVYDNGKKSSIDTFSGVVPYGSEVSLHMIKSEKSGYYYPKAINIIKYNEEVVDDNPFK